MCQVSPSNSGFTLTVTHTVWVRTVARPSWTLFQYSEVCCSNFAFCFVCSILKSYCPLRTDFTCTHVHRSKVSAVPEIKSQRCYLTLVRQCRRTPASVSPASQAAANDTNAAAYFLLSKHQTSLGFLSKHTPAGSHGSKAQLTEARSAARVYPALPLRLLQEMLSWKPIPPAHWAERGCVCNVRGEKSSGRRFCKQN